MILALIKGQKQLGSVGQVQEALRVIDGTRFDASQQKIDDYKAKINHLLRTKNRVLG